MVQEIQIKSSDMQQLSDTLTAMRYQEDKTSNNIDYFQTLKQNGINKSSEKMVDEVCREKMAIWFFQVIEFFSFSRIIPQISMSYLDRFLGIEECSCTLNDRRDYQLTAICCLLLAVKIHQPQRLELELLSHLSQGTYSILEFKKKERDILSALNWRMCIPTASCFASYYIELLPKNLPLGVKEHIVYLSSLQIEYFIKDYYFSVFKPSLIALSSILNAIDALKMSNTLVSQSFHRDLILIAGIPAGINIYDIQEKMRSHIQHWFPSTKKNINDKYDIMKHFSGIEITSNCIRSQQA